MITHDEILEIHWFLDWIITGFPSQRARVRAGNKAKILFPDYPNIQYKIRKKTIIYCKKNKGVNIMDILQVRIHPELSFERWVDGLKILEKIKLIRVLRWPQDDKDFAQVERRVKGK